MPKKKTALTIEERLQQALVPAEEQPYEVPENWAWVRLGDVNKYISKSVNPISEPDKIFELYSVPSMVDNYPEIIAGSDIGSSKQSVCKKDVLLCKINPRINRVWKVSQFTDNELIASSEWIVIRNNHIDANYLMYCFQSKYFREFMLSNVSGVGGSLMRAQPKYVQTYPIPLPPLSEQQRIVERIEELFAKLDEAKERLQEVADSFAVRKAAILHKAFTGELTKKHEIEDSIVIRDKLFAERENMVQEKVLKRVKIKPLIQDEYKSQLAKNWVQCKLGEVAFVTKLAGFEYTKYIHLEDTGEIPVVRAQNVRKGYLDTTNLLYISKSVSDALSRSALKEKSVLITFIRAGIGDACVFDENQQYHLAPNVAKVEPFNKSEEKLNVYFLLYYLLSSFGQYEIFKNMKATAQPSLSMETIREIIIPLPSIEEQHEIVRLIDDLLARERSAQQATEQALASIDLMKKSILARAFRGELGTNKASEASALELLKQVLAEN